MLSSLIRVLFLFHSRICFTSTLIFLQQLGYYLVQRTLQHLIWILMYSSSLYVLPRVTEMLIPQKYHFDFLWQFLFYKNILSQKIANCIWQYNVVLKFKCVKAGFAKLHPTLMFEGKGMKINLILWEFLGKKACFSGSTGNFLQRLGMLMVN